jgi:hypothetical protein
MDAPCPPGHRPDDGTMPQLEAQIKEKLLLQLQQPCADFFTAQHVCRSSNTKHNVAAVRQPATRCGTPVRRTVPRH